MAGSRTSTNPEHTRRSSSACAEGALVARSSGTMCSRCDLQVFGCSPALAKCSVEPDCDPTRPPLRRSWDPHAREICRDSLRYRTWQPALQVLKALKKTQEPLPFPYPRGSSTRFYKFLPREAILRKLITQKPTFAQHPHNFDNFSFREVATSAPCRFKQPPSALLVGKSRP